MLGIDTRAARATWTVLLIVLFVVIVYQVRESILIFVAAFFVAYMITPLVNAVSRVMPGRFSRTTSLIIVYLVLLSAATFIGVWVGARVVEEAANFAERAPDLIRKHSDLATVKVPEWLEPFKLRIVQAIQKQLSQGAERAVPLIQRTVGHVATVLGSLGFLILVPILTFLFLKDGEKIREDVLSWIPSRHRKVADDITNDIHVLLVQYIRALVILSILTSVIYLTFFEIIGLPYALLLSVLAAPLEFIPVFGPLVGTLLILLVAMFTGYPHIWWIVIFFAAYRAFQDYALQPYLMSAGIELHPLLVIFGALAGQEVGGLWGMFLSLPVLASIRIVLVNLRRRRRQRDLMLGEGASELAPSADRG